MAEEENNLDEETGSNDKDGKKKKPPLMVIIAAVLVLLIGGGGVVWYLGLLGGGAPSGQQADTIDTPSVYMDMPEMVVNLASGRERAQYLKLKVSIEAASQSSLNALQPKMPRIQDMFQVYLREMRRQDLEGSAGVYRLKQELKRRINITIHPARIKRVLFKEIIIQ